MTFYPWILSAHIISVIAWMIGLMYLPRLFIYHHQAAAGGEAQELFLVMERRLVKGIMTPAMMASWVFGLSLVAINPAVAVGGWFSVKLGIVFALTGIHGFYSKSRKVFEEGERPQSEKFWRLMNEIPFIGLIIIVILVVVKPF